LGLEADLVVREVGEDAFFVVEMAGKNAGAAE